MVKYIGASVEAWVVFQLLVIFCTCNHNVADFIAIPQCSTNSKAKLSIFDVHNIGTGLLIGLKQILKFTTNPLSPYRDSRGLDMKGDK